MELIEYVNFLVISKCCSLFIVSYYYYYYYDLNINRINIIVKYSYSSLNTIDIIGTQKYSFTISNPILFCNCRLDQYNVKKKDESVLNVEKQKRNRML